jgi:hypothetical protein
MRPGFAAILLLGTVSLCGCAGRGGLPTGAIPAAPPASEAAPPTTGIVPLTLEQERELD